MMRQLKDYSDGDLTAERMEAIRKQSAMWARHKVADSPASSS
ncbi:MAG: hypothetical protein ABI446_00600 [Gemmatimonadaceae bacterium]